MRFRLGSQNLGIELGSFKSQETFILASYVITRT